MAIEVENQIQKGIELIRQQVKQLPETPGIYKMIDAQETIMYIGKAKSLCKRVASYANILKLPNRLKRMVSQLHNIEIITTKSEAEALLLEANLIQAHKPIYNIALRDDKSFPYILIEEDHAYPRITKHRGAKTKKGSYYGPFASAKQVNETIVELQKVFLIRPCSNPFFESRTRPCLQHQIRRCSAPCVGKIDEAAYKKTITQVKNFLSGKSNLVQEQLVKEMQLASENQQYEKAASLRDRIQILNQIQAKNIFSNNNINNADIFAIYCDDHGNTCFEVFFIRGGKNYGNKEYFYNDVEESELSEIFETFLGQFYQRNHPPEAVISNIEITDKKTIEEALFSLHKEKVKIFNPEKGVLKDILDFAIENAKNALQKKLREKLKNISILQELIRLFHLKKVPQRIEIFDNSHIQGSQAVGCMVVATPSGFDKAQYRTYNIRATEKADDYAMLREVLRRRLSKLSSENYPNLMIVDGGRGHLSVATEVMQELNISDIQVVCMAKGVDRNAGKEFFHIAGKHEFQLPRRSQVLHYLHMLRNEAHNFAITTHRKKRSKELSKSKLDDVPGIGKKRKLILLNFFGSVDEIKKASTQDLCKIKGISKKTAKTIFDYLH